MLITTSSPLSVRLSDLVPRDGLPHDTYPGGLGLAHDLSCSLQHRWGTHFPPPMIPAQSSAALQQRLYLDSLYCRSSSQKPIVIVIHCHFHCHSLSLSLSFIVIVCSHHPAAARGRSAAAVHHGLGQSLLPGTPHPSKVPVQAQLQAGASAALVSEVRLVPP